MRLDSTLNARDQIYLQYKNEEYADYEEEFYRDTLEMDKISFNLGRPIRIAFYNRYRPAVDPLYTDKLTEIAKLWLPRIGSLERVIIEKEGSWKQYEKLNDGDYDLIVTPDIHQFGDTVPEALERISRLHLFVYFELESMFSEGGERFFTLQLLMSEETAEKELLRDERHYFLEREEKTADTDMQHSCPYMCRFFR